MSGDDMGSTRILGRSRITAEGRLSIPVSVLRQLGLSSGEVLIWEVIEDHMVVKREGRHTLGDIQEALQIACATSPTDDEIRDGVKSRTKAKHGRR